MNSMTTIGIHGRAEAVFEQAIAAGATEVFTVSQEHDWRIGRVAGPFGHHWEIGKPLRDWPPARRD